MELTNKRISYNVSNSSDTFKLDGSVTLNAESLVDNFSGSITKDSTNVGSFYYSETSDERINISFNNIEAVNLTDAESFITGTVADIKKA